jgi:hypothetical protein
MNFKIHGPFVVTLTGAGLVDTTPAVKRAFWDNAPDGLDDAVGCYVFALRTSGRGTPKPWYVGVTQSGFRGECFEPHKINHYNTALGEYERAMAELTFVAKVTPARGDFAKPSTNGYAELEKLEEFLIGIAYAQNKRLRNVVGTALFRDALIPGVLNSPAGNPGHAASSLRVLLGL